MQFTLLLYSEEAGWSRLTQREQEEAMAAYGAYIETLTEAGVLKLVDRLQPSATARTVRVAQGKTQVQEGSFSDAKEQLGGYFIIEAPDLAAALAWAERCPAASHGVVEVRPSWCRPE